MLKNNNKKLIIIVILILFVIGLIVGITLGMNSKHTLKLEEIEAKDAKYFILQKDNKYGVIDTNGQVIIEPQYDGLKIPNPTKEVFICLVDSNNEIWNAVDINNEKLWTNYTSVDAISLKTITSLVPYEKTVLKYQEGNLYGIMDYEGNKITEAEYEEIVNIDYKEGYLKVKKEENYGVIDIKGQKILDEEYENILSDGYYDEKTKYSEAGFILRVKTDDGYKFGYATTSGKVVLEPIYNEVNRITEIENNKDVYFITSLNGRYGLLKNNKTILENEYINIDYDKTNEIVIAQKDSSKGVFDINGKNIIPIDYDTIIIGGEYINAIKDENTIIFDKNGNTINTEDASKEKVSDKYSIIIDKDDNYNIVDNSNKRLLNTNYSYLEYFRDDLFIATNESKTGLIKADGSNVVPLEYNTIQKIDGTNCLQAMNLDDNKNTIINSKGEIQEGLENGTIIQEENYLEIISDKAIKYFTLDGDETTYKNLFPNNTIYATKQNDKWGFKDSDGNVIVDYQYDFVTEQNGNSVGVKKDGKWGVLDLSGNVVKECTYELEYNDVKFLGEYYAIYSNLGLPIYCGD